MAYSITSFVTSSGIVVSNAYLRITKIEVQHGAKMAVVYYSIYASKELAEAGKPAIQSDGYAFDGDLYEQNFAAPPSKSPLAEPADVNDILQTQAYVAMKNHPSLSSLLESAIAV